MGIFRTASKRVRKVTRKCVIIFLPGVILAVILYLAINKMSKPFSTPAYCGSECHEMNAAYESWEVSIHNSNRRGLVAECIDCHLPDKDNFIIHMSAKTQAGIKDMVKHRFGGEYDLKKIRQKVLDDMPNKRCLACHANLLGKPGSSAARAAHTEILNPPGNKEFKCVGCHDDLHVRDNKIYSPE